ncbi:hypothetical protein, partial [Gordonia alkanivorans]|uniref:hypothetical protein n=1 Tax=Gordonia alkanivorans TaxID=84096 RepID=UPI001E3BC9E7
SGLNRRQKPSADVDTATRLALTLGLTSMVAVMPITCQRPLLDAHMCPGPRCRGSGNPQVIYPTQ